MSARGGEAPDLLPGADIRIAEVLDQLPATVGVFMGPELVVRYANPLYATLAGKRELVGRPVAEVFDEPENAPFVEALRRAYEHGETVTGQEWSGIVPDPRTGAMRTVWFDFAFVPLRSPAGEVRGALLHAMEVTRLVEAHRSAEESERRLRMLAESGVVGVITVDAFQVVEANDAFLAFVGRTRKELEAGGIPLASITPPEWREVTEHAWHEVSTTGRVAFEKEYVRPDGTRMPAIVGSVRIDTDPVRTMSVIIDRTAQREAERERERLLVREREARRQAEVTVERIGRLQRATAALAAAISPAEVGEATVTQALEALGADAASLGLVDEDEVVLIHDRGYSEEDAARWRRFPATGSNPIVDALRTRSPVWVEGWEDWERWPAMKGRVRWFAGLAAIPLVASGRSLGALALSFVEPRRLDAGERAFLLALADLAAAALDRARLYEQRAYVARTLQAGLLPEEIRSPEGLEVAVRYHSIADGGEVGGDFYDFFDVARDRWLVAVGDVAGKGSAAAVLTGLARHTMRAIATREERPGAILAFLNEALRRQSTEAAFCTVGCATLTRTATGFDARLSSGGHPYPLLVRAGSQHAEEVPVRGTLLGVEPDPELEEVDLPLGPGDLLVLRTDGVEDARGPDGTRFGEDRVVAAVGAAAGGTADAVAAAVDAAVAAHEHGGPRRDDRAIVVVRVTP